tara:strand:+ start:247 stop:579 length:333 start_codon:yes stop_codon:yes gene_type:complete
MTNLDNLATSITAMLREAIQEETALALKAAADDFDFDDLVENSGYDAHQVLQDAADEFDYESAIQDSVEEFNFDHAIRDAVGRFNFDHAIGENIAEMDLSDRFILDIRRR